MIKLKKYIVRRSKYCHLDLFLQRNKSILKKYLCLDKKNLLFFSLSSLKRFSKKAFKNTKPLRRNQK